MELTFNRVDIQAAEARNIKPSDLITRGHANEVWMVPFSPVTFTDVADWRHYKREHHVVIPMFPYLVPASPTDALGYAFQLGVNAMHQLGGRPVRRLHLSLGEPINQVVNEHDGTVVWSFHMGIGIVFE